MTPFFKAIYTHFAADQEGGGKHAFYNKVGGQFSYGEAEPEFSDTYAVYHGLPMTQEDTFTETIDNAPVQINIFSDSKLAAMEAGDSCLDLFDGAVLSVSGLDVTLNREMVTPPWRDGERWVVSIEFITFLQRG